MCFALGVTTSFAHPSHQEGRKWTPPSMAHQVRALGQGIRFVNDPVPEGAQTPETGADYVYARTFSANSRNCPMGIEVWVFSEAGAPLHDVHRAYLQKVYGEIYGWNPDAWKRQLGDNEQASNILREKSDFFWESLAQQLAERIFGAAITPALYRLGPGCIDAQAAGCQDEGLTDAHQVVVRTYLNARRDTITPVTRSITYSAGRGELADPELLFELQVPNGLKVAGPHQERLDFRPRIGGTQDAVNDIRIWAQVPRGRRDRTKNEDYPDYNLIFVPLRHLVFQGEVEDPKQPASGIDYPDQAALIQRAHDVIDRLRTAAGGQAVATEVTPFLTAKYYYMYGGDGQSIDNYRNYILGHTAGIAHGLNPDFGRIEVMIDGARAATFTVPTSTQ